MKIIDYAITISVLVIIAVLIYFGYSFYQEYENNQDNNAPGTTPGGQPASSFLAFGLDKFLSIGQSPQDYSNALVESVGHPYDTFKELVGID